MSGELAAILTKWGNPPAEMVDLLPKLSCKACTDSKFKQCDKHTKKKCRECHAWISEAHVHLDYMGHASVRRALIETDENWNWEPVAFTEAGEPLITTSGTGNSTHLRMWIRLTVLGKSVLGVGTCGSSKPEPEKELIGDALRNAAMSLGIGLSLWAKDEWNDLGSSAGSGVSSAPSSPSTARAASSPAAARATSSGHGSPGTGDGPTAGDGPSPADVVDRIRGLDEQMRADVKEYARSKGYKVTPASLTAQGAKDLAAWLDRRQAS